MQLLLDLNNISYRCLFTCLPEIKSVGWKYLKLSMYNVIINTCKQFKPDQVFICADHKLNWRRKIYPEYKQNRKEKREQHDIDWDMFFQTFNEFVVECKNIFPFYVLQIKYLEADDIVGILCRKYREEDKIVVSTDTDFIQVLKYPNVKLYDPIQKKYRQHDDPEKFLKIKFLQGDRKDNIGPVKPRIGEKTAEKMVEDDDLFNELMNDPLLGEEIKAKYERNKKLIDLRYTPKVLIESLMKEYEEYQLPDGKSIYRYIVKNKFTELENKIQDITNILQSIKDYENAKVMFS